ncbi:MAG TPA: GHMP kinase [Acidilobales archaeon]|nr:GHMP kinase [Acidilobales archaeon]
METNLNVGIETPKDKLELRTTIKEFKDFYGYEPYVISSSPGRLDFLNTHQDYKGLPVVGIAVNLRVYIALRRIEGSEAIIASGNLMDQGVDYVDRFDVSKVMLRRDGWFGDYFRATYMYLREMGYTLGGVKAWVRSWVPIASGLGSSGALITAFLGGLNEVFDLGLSTSDIAEAAYRVEHYVMGIPCGRLDQYTSAYGGVVLINTKPPYDVRRLRFKEGVFAVLDSCIKHSTMDVHSIKQRELREALSKLITIANDELRKKLSTDLSRVSWEELTEEELMPYLSNLPMELRNRVLFTLRMHESTKLALKVIEGVKPKRSELSRVLKPIKCRVSLRSSDWFLKVIGCVMTYQHILLRDLYEVSTPELDRLVRVSIRYGAYGAKLSGAGMGGVVIALFKDIEEANNLVNHCLRRRYACRGYVVSVDEGLRTWPP